MPRISEEQIAHIKATVDLAAVIRARGIALEKHGVDNLVGLCPFHDDKRTANLIVTPEKGLFRCMSCGAAGNVIQFVEKFDGLSFRHAVELLTDDGGIAATAYRRTPDTRKLPCPVSDTAGDAEALAQVIAYYQERFTHHPDGMDYLEKRGLGCPELVARFRVGFADRTLGLRIPQRKCKEGAELRDRLKAMGVFRRRTGHEHLVGCITVPLYDIHGTPRQIYGRRIEANISKELRHLYLARPLAGIFNPDALKSPEIILCESIIDAMTFVRHGSEAGLAVMEAATCTFGTANFTDEIFEAIKSAGVESVRLAFDADEAGEKAAQQATTRLQAVGIECHRIRFPWGSDANSFALDRGGEALKAAVRSAQWLGAVGPVLTKEDPEEKPAPEIPPPQPPQKPEVSPSTGDAETTTNPVQKVPLSSSLAAEEKAAKKGKIPESPEPANTPAPVSAPVPVRKGEHHEITFGPRAYRVGGLFRNNGLEIMKITLRLACADGSMHIDSLDLYRDGERRRFAERAAEEAPVEKETVKADLGRLLLALESVQEQRLAAPIEDAATDPELSQEEQRAALDFARAPDLLRRIGDALAASGLVGERANALAIYLCATSRLLPKPLAAVIQSTSAAGKTTLMEAVLALFPAGEQVKYSAMTGQSLYYMAERSLKNKVLAIVEEEGAQKASYALKLLQSEGELTIASTGKDATTGRMKTEEYHVEGPAAIVLTTTSVDIDEELMNRCLVLSVDESRAQTEAIQQAQRHAETPEGILQAEECGDTFALLKNFQRILRPIKVANPFAGALTFTAERTRTRRDHTKYLALIKSIALLHQHARPTITGKTRGGRLVEMLPVTIEDIEAANAIAPEVLGRSLDELPPQTRRLLESIKSLVARKSGETKAGPGSAKMGPGSAWFSRREVRQQIGWSEFQTRTHMGKLEEMEYLARRQGRQGIGFLYELLIDPATPEGTARIGLLDTAELRRSVKNPKLC
jgi:DNA primase catalytic core